MRMRGTWFTSRRGDYLAQVVNNNFEGGDPWVVYIYKAKFLPDRRVSFGGVYSEDFPYENLLGEPLSCFHGIQYLNHAIEIVFDEFEKLEGE